MLSCPFPGICKATGMTFTDVVSTLSALDMVKRNDTGK